MSGDTRAFQALAATVGESITSRLVDVEPPVLDPVLWERLSYLRPMNMPWPTDVVARLAAREPLPGVNISGNGGAMASDEGANPADAETIIWHSIGHGGRVLYNSSYALALHLKALGDGHERRSARRAPG